GQDDIVFDGGSFVVAADGAVVQQLAEFGEGMDVVALEKGNAGWSVASARPFTPLAAPQTLWQAMMMGLSNYVRKNNFSGVVLGLSGGVDSALSAALAVDALGPDKVKGVLLPS